MNEGVPSSGPESQAEKTANIELTRCGYCGHIVEPGGKFCSSCGGSLVDATGALPVTEDNEPLPSVDDTVLSEVGVDDVVLVVHRGPDAGAKFSLTGDDVSVGRSEDAVIFLDDVTVSRRHAELRKRDGDWSVLDNRSLNGTYVNRKRIDEQVLANGDELQIGKYRFIFYQAAS
jgi:hypothetical protein